MTRHHTLPAILFVLTLIACGPAPSGIALTGQPATQATAGSTATDSPPVTVPAGTVSVGTAVPIFMTDLPPGYTPPPSPVPPTLTPIPSLSVGFGPTELKYRLLGQFPDFFYCDPDYYPVARADEMELARQRFPELQANTEEFNAILSHNGLSGLAAFTDDQKLLIYREHKKLAAIPFELATNGYNFQMQIAESEGEGELVTGTIDGQGAITVQHKTPSFATCPICLAADTLISTPDGSMPAQELRVGMMVWTVDDAGARVAAPLIRVSKTAVPATHQVIQIALSDGRKLWASPGHPTADGRTLGELQPGDSLDGAFISAIERILYAGLATYDLLPAGHTGFYWANGILLASTLK